MRLTEECPAIASFVEESIAAWNVTNVKEFPALGRPVSEGEQQEHETRSIAPSGSAEAELRTQPATTSDRKEVYGSHVRPVATACQSGARSSRSLR